MKILLLYIVGFFIFSGTFAQEKKIQIKWVNNQSLNEEGYFTEVPLAENVSYNIDDSGLFKFGLTWEANGFSYDNSSVSNVVYESVETAKLININKDKLPNQIEFSVNRSFARGKVYENLNFTPIVKVGNVYKKVMSFSLKGDEDLINTTNRSAKTLDTNEISSSVLASGNWFKFEIGATGVYKITPQFLESIGFNLNGVDANTIKVYGNGGKPLPLLNDENEFFDIPENPIKIVGAEDGVFSGADYILFYGRGTRGFVEEHKSHINPYDDHAYYYITSGGSISKKVSQIIEPIGAPSQIFNTYDYYTFYEEDLVNLGQLGRIWHGDKFDGLINSRDYELSFPELSLDSKIDIEVVFSAIYGVLPQLGIQVNDQSGFVDSANGVFSGLNIDNNAYENISPSLSIDTGVTNVSGDKLIVNLNYNQGADASSEGYLDYISLNAECLLKGAGNQFIFSNSLTANEGDVGQFAISNTSDLMGVWDVTDPYNISEKINNNASEMEVSFNLGTLKEYVAIDKRDLYSPIPVLNSRVNNQNLKGTVFRSGASQFEDVDYLILTNANFLGPAQRLANFRALNDGFNVKIIDVALVYNEFSTGKQDIGAIRNFVKYIYDNGTYLVDGSVVEDKRLKYICIIGDGSYDYKDRIPNNTNHVPLYHAIESSSLPNSFSTDDFYCFMDNDEGGDPGDDKMDISVGRIIARSSAEASTMVDKIISYYNREAYGDWRNSMLFLSDDVDLVSDGQIQEKIIEISNKLENEVERVNVKRILTDSYVQQITSGGARYEEASKDFEDAFELGMSYINYFGHGGEDGITGEFVFTAGSAQNLTNQERLPVFVTLTCELTRFDNPNRLTAGEFLYWNPIGGAVALISTTRNLFLSTGLRLNDSLSDALFDENSLTVPIGDAVRISKNTLSGPNKRTVFCFGDPALKVVLPKPEVELTEVNSVPFDLWSTDGNSLKALDRVALKGKIVDGVGGVDLTSYKGEVTISIFDKDVKRNTLVNDGVGESVSFTESGNLIYKGLASVANGEFSSEFVLPKSVQLEVGEGKVSFYAENGQSLDDQSGSDIVAIGGLNTDAAEDVTPPVIRLFINDETFFSGQVVGASSSIVAKFSDENGINTAGGVGHDIVAVLDGDESNPIILNEYYSTNLDDFTTGQLIYKLNNLEAGEHTLSLRASDTYNNSSIEEITFIVNESGDFSLINVLNYPNPFVSYTEFWFSHNGIPNDTLEVSVQVMTVTGKIVTTKFATLSGESSYRAGLTWDGKDDFGNKIGKGVYVYKITAKSTLTNKTTSEFQKLVVL